VNLTEAASLLREATIDDTDPVRRELMMELIRETYPDVWAGIVSVIDSLDVAEEARIREDRLSRLKSMFDPMVLDISAIEPNDEMLLNSHTFEMTTGRMTRPGEAPDMTSKGEPWSEVYPSSADPAPAAEPVARGWYIAIEGIDGSGKTTQARRIADELFAVLFREPGDTPVGDSLREIVKDRSLSMNQGTEAYLFAAARSELLPDVSSLLDRGINVVVDRSVISSIAYQAERGELTTSEVLEINRVAVTEAPDLVILLDLPVDAALERTGSSRDAMEDRVDMERVRERYLSMANGKIDLDYLSGVPWAVVHCDGMDEHSVTGYIINVLEAHGVFL